MWGVVSVSNGGVVLRVTVLCLNKGSQMSYRNFLTVYDTTRGRIEGELRQTKTQIKITFSCMFFFLLLHAYGRPTEMTTRRMTTGRTK